VAKITIKAGRRVAQTKPSPVQVKRDKVAPAPRGKAKPETIDYKLDGLSLKALIRATPPFIKNNAHEVLVKMLKPATTKGGFPAIRAKVLSVGNKGQRNVYATDIIGKEKDIPLSRQKHVLVSCQCDYFLYYCEVALNHWGSAKIKYSNGEHPNVTNPQLQPMLCKHLVRLAGTVIEEHM
jgi:hypothetical protein